MSERKVIGVDFGSSQCSMSIMKLGAEGAPSLIDMAAEKGVKILPTRMVLDKNDGKPIGYGEEVTDYMEERYRGDYLFVSDFKRYLGCSEDPSVPEEYRDADKYCREFIRHLASIAKATEQVKSFNSDDYVTCISYPATWSAGQISLLKQMFEEAGFPADSHFGIYAIPEPEAAMHALRVQSTVNFKFENKPGYYMVIDFGGGTLDICVIRTDIFGATPTIVSTSGNPKFGGRDFDEIIEDRFFKVNREVSKKALTAQAYAKLKKAFKTAKEQLSLNFVKNDDHTIQIEVPGGSKYVMEFSKNEFDGLCNDKGCFKKIEDSIDAALKGANLETSDITKVILTGGSSKWYFVKRIAAAKLNLLQSEIVETETPFTDVAIGDSVCKGRTNEPKSHDGIWVKWRSPGIKDDWSDPISLLRAGRLNVVSEKQRAAWELPGSQYFTKRTIYISWWIGPDVDHIAPMKRPDGEDAIAIVEFYPRSNWYFLERFKSAYEGFKLNKYSAPDDYYLFQLFYVETPTGQEYEFEILNNVARAKARAINSSDKNVREDAAKMPEGRKISGTIHPGQHRVASFWNDKRETYIKVES